MIFFFGGRERAGWLVGWLLGLNGPLRQYYSLYRAVGEKEGAQFCNI